MTKFSDVLYSAIVQTMSPPPTVRSGSAARGVRVCTILLGVVSLAIFHLLTLHLVWPIPAALPLLVVLLAGLWLLGWFGSRSARSIPVGNRSALAVAWARVDGETFALLGLLAALLIGFYLWHTRAGGDGRDYYIQLRSMLIDFDFDFRNEIAEFGGREPQTFPIGSAILWAPFFLLCHLWLGMLGVAGADVRRDGYWNPYQMAAGLGSLIYGFIGLVLAYRLLRRYFSASVAFVSVASVALGSFLIYYLTMEGSYTHANSFFAVTLFICLWVDARDDVSVRRWVILGAAAGLMMLVRWQNAIFFALPLAGIVSAFSRQTRRPIVTAYLASIVTSVLVFSPQFVFWKIVNGGWLAVPHGQAGQQWWSDSLAVDVLFSSNHGLFAWHPVLYLAAIGVPFFFKKDPRLTAFLGIAFLVEAYINGANATWYGGSAFGGRRFDGCLLLFMLGLGSLVAAVCRRPMTMVVPALAAAIVFNVTLAVDVRRAAIPSGEGATFEQMVHAIYTRIGNPFSFPASALFARKYGSSLAQYDRAARNWYYNVRIDVGGEDEPFLGDGWGGRERDGDTSFRWAIGQRALVFAPIRSELRLAPGQPMQLDDYRFKFHAQPFEVAGMSPQSVELVVNGSFAARQELQPGWSDYEVRIANDLLRRNVNGIELRFAYAKAPSDVAASDDHRPLAARFDTIELIRQSAE